MDAEYETRWKITYFSVLSIKVYCRNLLNFGRTKPSISLNCPSSTLDPFLRLLLFWFLSCTLFWHFYAALSSPVCQHSFSKRCIFFHAFLSFSLTLSLSFFLFLFVLLQPPSLFSYFFLCSPYTFYFFLLFFNWAFLS